MTNPEIIALAKRAVGNAFDAHGSDDPGWRAAYEFTRMFEYEQAESNAEAQAIWDRITFVFRRERILFQDLYAAEYAELVRLAAVEAAKAGA